MKDIDEVDIVVNALMDFPLLFNALSTGSTWGKYQILGVREQVRESSDSTRPGGVKPAEYITLPYTQNMQFKKIFISSNHVIFEYVMIYSIYHMLYILSTHKGFLNKLQKWYQYTVREKTVSVHLVFVICLLLSCLLEVPWNLYLATANRYCLKKNA